MFWCASLQQFEQLVCAFAWVRRRPDGFPCKLVLVFLLLNVLLIMQVSPKDMQQEQQWHRQLQPMTSFPAHTAAAATMSMPLSDTFPGKQLSPPANSTSTWRLLILMKVSKIHDTGAAMDPLWIILRWPAAGKAGTLYSVLLRLGYSCAAQCQTKLHVQVRVFRAWRCLCMALQEAIGGASGNSELFLSWRIS